MEGMLIVTDNKKYILFDFREKVNYFSKYCVLVHTVRAHNCISDKKVQVLRFSIKLF